MNERKVAQTRLTEDDRGQCTVAVWLYDDGDIDVLEDRIDTEEDTGEEPERTKRRGREDDLISPASFCPDSESGLTIGQRVIQLSFSVCSSCRLRTRES